MSLNFVLGISPDITSWKTTELIKQIKIALFSRNKHFSIFFLLVSRQRYRNYTLVVPYNGVSITTCLERFSLVFLEYIEHAYDWLTDSTHITSFSRNIFIPLFFLYGKQKSWFCFSLFLSFKQVSQLKSSMFDFLLTIGDWVLFFLCFCFLFF